MLFKIFGKSGNPFAKGFLAGGQGQSPSFSRSPINCNLTVD